MEILLSKRVTGNETCPYLNDRPSANEYFLARNVTQDELDELLETGWRKFGPTYFKPACPNCTSCIPIRVKTKEFQLSSEQKRIVKKNNDIELKFSLPNYREEIFDLYKKHSLTKFNQEVSKEEFLMTHFYHSTTSLQAEYYLKNRLVSVGFLDVGKLGLNSVYFIYDPDFSKRSLGTLGALKEIEFARLMDIPYYYLGYYIAQNPSMSYKNRFRPYQLYDWKEGIWKD